MIKIIITTFCILVIGRLAVAQCVSEDSILGIRKIQFGKFNELYVRYSPIHYQ